VPRWDAGTARCEVLTFKAGLLSKVAHDLKLEVRDFEVVADPDAGTVTARFQTGSVRAVCAMRDGEPAPGVLSEADLADIERRMTKDVLHPRRFPEVTYSSVSVEADGDGWRLLGRLSLHGVEHDIRCRTTRTGDELTAEVRLDQRDYGIKPYTAMLGALKIRPEVVVRLSVPAADVRQL